MKGRNIGIVYEDRWMLVINKPSGLLSVSTSRSHTGITRHGSGEAEVTAYSLASEYVGKRIFIVHRLDRDTSGLMILAKDEETKRILQEGWSEHVLERSYVAMVKGCPDPMEGTVTSWLKEHPKSLKMSSCPYDNGGQKAVTRYSVVKPGKTWSVVRFSLETGRKNQIRVHSALIGHPVAGDRRYWDFTGRYTVKDERSLMERGEFSNPVGRLALHAETLVMKHPHTGKEYSFVSKAPSSFRAF